MPHAFQLAKIDHIILGACLRIFSHVDVARITDLLGAGASLGYSSFRGSVPRRRKISCKVIMWSKNAMFAGVDNGAYL